MPVPAVPRLADKPPAGFSRFVIEVGNVGSAPVEEIDVAICCDDPTRKGEVEIGGKRVNMAGRRFPFESDDTGPLEGNARRWYYLPTASVDPLKQVLDYLSPDQFWAAITTPDDQRQIDGGTVGWFVARL